MAGSACRVSGGLVPILGLREPLQLIQPQFSHLSSGCDQRAHSWGRGRPHDNVWHEGSAAYD